LLGRAIRNTALVTLGEDVMRIETFNHAVTTRNHIWTRYWQLFLTYGEDYARSSRMCNYASVQMLLVLIAKPTAVTV
jgi:hypothetical protein